MKGILIDFGGTIDTDGRHWYKVFKQIYSSFFQNIDDTLLRDAYVYAERTLGRNPIIKPDFTFYNMLECKLSLQISYLEENGLHLTDIQKRELLDNSYSTVKENIDKVSYPELLKLSERCPMVLVTNFYGNMNTVLKEFGLDNLFYDIVESAVAGVRKPDTAIYTLAVQRLNLLPEDVVMIGDSLSKDIIPSMEVGCKAVWLKGEQWKDESASATCSPDFIVSTLKGVSELF